MKASKTYALIHFEDKKTIKRKHKTSFGAFSKYENDGCVLVELFSEHGVKLSSYAKPQASAIK